MKFNTVLVQMTEKQHELMNRFLSEAIQETWPEGFESARPWGWSYNDFMIAENALRNFNKNVFRKEDK